MKKGQRRARGNAEQPVANRGTHGRFPRFIGADNEVDILFAKR